MNNYNDLFVIVLISIVCAFAVVFFFKKILKKTSDHSLFFLFVIISLFFSYQHIVEFVGAYELFGFNIKATYIYILLVIALSYFAWKISNNQNFHKYSKIIIVTTFTFSCFNLSTIMFNCFKNKNNYLSLSQTNNTINYNLKHKPNVYYVLLDAYGRQDTLNETTGYSNDWFLEKLEKIGFIVSRKARANYHFTTASLSATMNMQYHSFDKNNYASCRLMADSLMGKNNVRNIFRNNKYKIISIPSHWHELMCHGYEDFCFTKGSYEIYEGFLLSTPLKIFKIYRKYTDFKDLLESIKLFKKNPKFIFLHSAHVHDAIYNSDGSLNGGKYPCFSGKDDSLNYVASIRAINENIFNIVNEIRALDPNSIIIIQSDHGPTYTGNLNPKDPEYWAKNGVSYRLVNKNDYRYIFGVFSAIYIPQYDKNKYEEIKKYFSGEFTLINTFRYIFAYLSDQKPELLSEDSHFLYSNDDSFDYKEENIEHFKH